MNGWTAIIPFKPAGARKTRLAGRLDERERDALSLALFDHVAAVLAAAPAVVEILVLAREKPLGWGHSWIADAGRELNAELDAARQRLDVRRLIVIHADLPFVRPEDISALAAGADAGDAHACCAHACCAVAPDSHGAGTNALALRDFPDFRFCFGAGSFALHVEAAGERARIVALPGLSFDIDTVDDYEEAGRRGWPPRRHDVNGAVSGLHAEF
jgi:2-phospho-L-lactate guanylyltransferase